MLLSTGFFVQQRKDLDLLGKAFFSLHSFYWSLNTSTSSILGRRPTLPQK